MGKFSCFRLLINYVGKLRYFKHQIKFRKLWMSLISLQVKKVSKKYCKTNLCRKLRLRGFSHRLKKWVSSTNAKILRLKLSKALMHSYRVKYKGWNSNLENIIGKIVQRLKGKELLQESKRLKKCKSEDGRCSLIQARRGLVHVLTYNLSRTSRHLSAIRSWNPSKASTQ